MASFNLQKISKNFLDTLRTNPAEKSGVANDTSDKIVLTFDYANTDPLEVRTAATATTLMTTPTDKDFYLLSFYITGSGAAAQTTNTITLTADDGSTQVFTLIIAGSATVVCNNSVSHTFPRKGLKVKRGTAITTGVGASGSFMISGIFE